jgi:hypothetical protein
VRFSLQDLPRLLFFAPQGSNRVAKNPAKMAKGQWLSEVLHGNQALTSEKI